MDARNDHDVRDHLRKIQCPILLHKGKADYYVSPEAVEKTVAKIPGGLAEGGIAKGVADRRPGKSKKGLVQPTSPGDPKDLRR